MVGCSSYDPIIKVTSGKHCYIDEVNESGRAGPSSSRMSERTANRLDIDVKIDPKKGGGLNLNNDWNTLHLYGTLYF
jgi:hypothetical protein